MERREFVRIGSGGLGALLLGVRTTGPLAEAAAGERGAAAFAPNAFLRIDADGRVTFIVPVPEMGQGVRTGLCMIIAEELDVSPGAVVLEQADGDDARYGPRQRAAGSNTIKSYWMPLRRAGATARQLLVSAAAARWDVPSTSCATASGQVRHAATGRTVAYGDLVAAAALLPVPLEVALKSPADFKVIGQPTANMDIGAITDGSIEFGIDVERPGMLRAVIARCPVHGGRVQAVDDSATRSIPGVVRVFVIEPEGPLGRPWLQGGVAVLATSTWAALSGRAALRVTWDYGPNTTEDARTLRARAETLVGAPCEPVHVVGDALARIESAPRRLVAEYEVPFLAHAPLEPMNCVADVRDGRCELWAPVQVPSAARQLAARATALPSDAVTVHVLRMGGGFGRRLGADYAAEAARLSLLAKAPVQVVWTREDDMRHGFYRPFGRHHLEVGLDVEGNVTGWLHRVASTSRYAFRAGEPASGSEVHAGDFPGNVLPHVRVEFSNLESTAPRGPLRAPRDNANAFVIESFLDEVAHVAGRDPLEFRLALLGPSRELPYEGTELVSTGRLANVLRLVAERGGWGTPAVAGRARGIASFYAYGSYVAQLAEVSVARTTGRIVVHRVTTAIDCGLVVNPSGVRAQVEGAVVDALSCLYREITFEEGRVRQSGFGDYRMLRMDDTPAMDVVLVPNAEPPSGAGEPPFPAVAPAVLNAVFAATGVRIRRLPVDPALLRG